MLYYIIFNINYIKNYYIITSLKKLLFLFYIIYYTIYFINYKFFTQYYEFEGCSRLADYILKLFLSQQSMLPK